MQFHDYSTLYQRDKAGRGRNEQGPDYYSRKLNARKRGDPTYAGMAMMAEGRWYMRGQPYYKVWPAITPALLRLSLDCKLRDLRLGVRTIVVRFPVGHELPVDGILVESILCEYNDDPQMGITYLHMMAQFSTSHGPSQLVMPPLNPARFSGTLEEWASGSDTVEPMSGCGPQASALGGNETERARAVLRVVVTIMLLADDPSIISPDVLSKDQSEYNRTTDAERKRIIEERAKRRGKLGWNVGAEYEVIPHFRRPHLALMWTGKGRKIPRIGPRKGSVVHRSKVTEVPTGHYTMDGREVESNRANSP